MNQDQFLSLVRTLAKVGGGYLVSKGIASDGTAQELIGAALIVAGWWWSHGTHAESPAGGPRFPGPVLFATLAAVLLTGCTSIMTSNKAVVITTKGFGVHITASSASANAAPDVLLGFYSVRVAMLPTSTNGPIAIPRYMDTFQSKSAWNPFETQLNDNIGFGDVLVGAGTNDTSRALWPTNGTNSFSR